VAGYSAVIDLRVNGLEGLRTVSDRIESINRLIKQIKPVPTLFDARGSAELKTAKNNLDQLVKKYADGGTQSARFASSIAGLNQQLTTFRSVAANAKTGSDQFTNAIKAAEFASSRLAKAEIERLNTLNSLYTRQATGRLTAGEQGPSLLTKEVLALGKNLPTSIAGLRSYASELDRVFALVEAGSIDFRTLQAEIARVNKQLDIATGAGPMQGPALPPSMQGGGGRRGLSSPIGGGRDFPGSPGAKAAMAENIMLGAGFPLLFGGGAGQVAGGLLGSFVGTGFGGQIIGSAIGQQLEDALRRITEIGNATKELNLDALRESTVYVNAELATTVRRLQEAGKAEEARARIGEAVARQTGVAPDATNRITQSVNLLGGTWNQFVGAVSGTISLLSGPFVSALQVILSGLTKLLQAANVIGSVLSHWRETIVSGIISRLPFLNQLIENTKNGVAEISEEEQKRVATLQALTDSQLKELLNTQKLLQLESQRTLGRTAAEKQINIEVEKQLANERIRTEYAEKAKKIREEFGNVTSEAGQRELNLALHINSALEAQALKQQQIKDRLAEQALQIEANTEKYNQAAEAVQKQIAALDRGNQVTQSRYSAEAALNDLYGAQLQRQYELATTAQERFNIALRMFEQQTRAAQIEYEQALNNNVLLVEKAKLEANLVDIKYKQLEAEKAIAIAQAKSRGNTPEQIQSIADAYDKGLGLQQEAVQAAYDQVQATIKIANNQNVVADAVYKTKIVQAESQLAQKLISDEIGLSQQQADRLAGSLASGVFQANEMSSAMYNVAGAAANAAQQIQNAINLQNMLRGGGDQNAGAVQAFAAGGYVAGPTRALVGEAGAEYVIPAGKMDAAMARYAAGARGKAVIPSSSQTVDEQGGNLSMMRSVSNTLTPGAQYSSSSPSMGGDITQTGEYAPSINPMISVTTGPVMNMNGSNYVSQRDFVAGMQAASRRGAELALSAMRNSGSVRRMIGAR